MKTVFSSVSLLLFLLCLSFTTSLYAQESSSVSFVIASPPVGYPVFTGEKTISVGGNAVYSAMTMMDEKFHLFGALGEYSQQQGWGSRFMFNLSAGAGMLVGNMMDMLIVPIPLHINAVFAPLKLPGFSLLLFGGAGGNLSLSTMTIEMATTFNATTVMDPVKATTLTTMGALNGGVQLNITVREIIASPYVNYYYTAGTYNSTFRTGLSDPAHNYVQSGQVDAVSHTIFGLDLLYKPLNITLSSFGRISRDQSLFSLAVKKLLNS